MGSVVDAASYGRRFDKMFAKFGDVRSSVLERESGPGWRSSVRAGCLTGGSSSS